ncbi:MAG: hypothetical protein DMG65_04820 [Candidatus Angelobacter sp. Gp1-AA117]|nr:MAG: hypothetical protein DMG65_04820 [Candidatus Angelobacter sp. Gp1-AA117]
MILTILAFELRQRLRRISTYIYFLVLFGLGLLFALLSGGAFPGAGVDFGTGGKVLLNSPFAIAIMITYISLFGMIITAAMAGQATYQDIDNNSTAFFYTAPISKFDYLAGRFLGALTTVFFIFPAVALGGWVGLHTHWIDPTRLGPEHAVAYVLPYLVLVFPNLLITTTIFFALAAFARKMLPVYAGSAILLIGYLVALQLSTNISANAIGALVDPFGSNAFDLVTRYWTPYERNTRLLTATGVLLWNRILWLLIAGIALALTYSRFSMSHVAGTGRRRVKAEPENIGQVKVLATPAILPEFSPAGSFRQFISLTQLQFNEVVRNVIFIVLMAIGFVFALVIAFDIGDPFSAPVYPVTYRMIALAGGAFNIFAVAITIFLAGELVWRERDAGVNQILDALPVQRWVVFASKLLALMLIQVIIVTLVTAAGVFVQIAHHYYHFEFGLYFTELYLNRLLILWVICALAIFIHTIVNQKYLGHFLLVLYYLVVLFVLPNTPLQHYMFRFGQLPAYTYSDMNGYGSFVKPLVWYHVYWGIAAILLALLTNLLWVRGTGSGWRERLRVARARLSTASGLGIAIGVILFAATGAIIFYNTNIRNIYLTSFRFEDKRAQYEKKYKQYMDLPQPRTTDLNLQIDVYPEERAANFQGTIWTENKTDQPIDRIAITLWPQGLAPLPRPKIELRKLQVAEGQQPVIEDNQLGFYLYRLPQPLAPHARLPLQFSISYAFKGFANSGENTDFAYNGSFLSDGYIPHIGYQQSVELGDDSTRHRHGLEKVKRIPKLEDVAARQNNYGTQDADWVNLEYTVSTSPDQIAIMPGYLQKEWMQDGRRYFHYKTDAPVLFGFSLNSAKYEVLRDRWRDVNLEIYYDHRHAFDIERMRESMKATLEYCSANFSPFQFHQLRIIEFPRYQTFAQSLANTIPFSEGIGFITRVDPKNPEDLDLPFYVTAHEVGHQWWGHQVVTANSEGATSVVESLAQYTALMVMKHKLGPAAMKNFLRHELDRYLVGRSQERNEEKPLLRVEPGQGYIHYRKGSLIMYAIQDYIGEDKMNQALAAFIKDYGFHGPPYPTSQDLVDHLRKVTPPELQYIYDDFFTNITLYENRAVSADYSQLPDGKYQVHMAVELKKSHADGRGQEQPIAPHDLVDIGVLDRDGNYLYLQKQKMDKENADFTVVVDKLPARAGIDPLNKLIDRKPDDNVIKVEKR